MQRAEGKCTQELEKRKEKEIRVNGAACLRAIFANIHAGLARSILWYPHYATRHKESCPNKRKSMEKRGRERERDVYGTIARKGTRDVQQLPRAGEILQYPSPLCLGFLSRWEKKRTNIAIELVNRERQRTQRTEKGRAREAASVNGNDTFGATDSEVSALSFCLSVFLPLFLSLILFLPFLSLCIFPLICLFDIILPVWLRCFCCGFPCGKETRCLRPSSRYVSAPFLTPTTFFVSPSLPCLLSLSQKSYRALCVLDRICLHA